MEFLFHSYVLLNEETLKEFAHALVVVVCFLVFLRTEIGF